MREPVFGKRMCLESSIRRRCGISVLRRSVVVRRDVASRPPLNRNDGNSCPESGAKNTEFFHWHTSSHSVDKPDCTNLRTHFHRLYLFHRVETSTTRLVHQLQPNKLSDDTSSSHLSLQRVRVFRNLVFLTKSRLLFDQTLGRQRPKLSQPRKASRIRFPCGLPLETPIYRSVQQLARRLCWNAFERVRPLP